MAKRAQEGYLLIDHRASPGVSAAFVRRVRRVGTIPVGEGATLESATITCAHCNTVVILNPDRTRPRGYCRRCDHYLCDSPACSRDCRPFQGLLIALQDAAYHQTEVRGVPVVVDQRGNPLLP